MLYQDIGDWYKTTYLIKHKLGFSIQELEKLYPYEREIYILLANEQIEKENKELEKYGKQL